VAAAGVASTTLTMIVTVRTARRTTATGRPKGRARISQISHELGLQSIDTNDPRY